MNCQLIAASFLEMIATCHRVHLYMKELAAITRCIVQFEYILMTKNTTESTNEKAAKSGNLLS